MILYSGLFVKFLLFPAFKGKFFTNCHGSLGAPNENAKVKFSQIELNLYFPPKNYPLYGIILSVCIGIRVSGF